MSRWFCLAHWTHVLEAHVVAEWETRYWGWNFALSIVMLWPQAGSWTSRVSTLSPPSIRQSEFYSTVIGFNGRMDRKHPALSHLTDTCNAPASDRLGLLAALRLPLLLEKDYTLTSDLSRGPWNHFISDQLFFLAAIWVSLCGYKFLESRGIRYLFYFVIMPSPVLHTNVFFYRE